MNGGDMDLAKIIRKIPDFPRKGIQFYDITSILTNPEAFRYCIDRIIESCREKKPDAVAAIEARGFVFAAPVAYSLHVPLILLRKKGKLPGITLGKKFTLEYGEDEIQVHRDDVRKGSTIILIDDLIATGGTTRAAVNLLEDAGGKIAGIWAIIGLPFLGYASALKDFTIKTLIDFESE